MKLTRSRSSPDSAGLTMMVGSAFHCFLIHTGILSLQSDGNQIMMTVLLRDSPTEFRGVTRYLGGPATKKELSMSTTVPSEHFQTTSESAASTPPIFPDNIQFWYETKRTFGAASYGASEFGEVLATVSRITSGDSIAGIPNGTQPPRELKMKQSNN
jgi:hypothetical protein